MTNSLDTGWCKAAEEFSSVISDQSDCDKLKSSNLEKKLEKNPMGFLNNTYLRISRRVVREDSITTLERDDPKCLKIV